MFLRHQVAKILLCVCLDEGSEVIAQELRGYGNSVRAKDLLAVDV